MNFYIPRINKQFGIFCLLLLLVCIIAYRKKRTYISIAAYVFIVMVITLFSRTYGQYRVILEPFWSYKVFFEKGFSWLAWQIIYNIVMMIPLGFLLSCGMKKRFSLLCGISISIIIELLQFFWHKGTAEFDDVFSNSLGVLIGIGIYTMVHYIREK